MANEFAAIIERDGDWYIAYCAEIPGAKGQGRTKEEARENLAEAIKLILQDRREDALALRSRTRNRDSKVKRGDLLRHLRRYGCYSKRDGRAHSLWCMPRRVPSRRCRATARLRTGSQPRFVAASPSPNLTDRQG